MRVGFPGGARLEWYDRNPADRSFTYGAGFVAPHSDTQRGSYTVPSGKKAFFAAALTQCRRDAAATAVGLVIVRTPWTNGQGLYTVHYDNTLHSKVMREAAIGTVLLPGNAVGISTLDASTGGSMDYRVDVIVVEFSA